jgi:hypothetical protein
LLVQRASCCARRQTMQQQGQRLLAVWLLL